MNKIVFNILVGCILLTLSVFDIRKKRISVKLLLCALAFIIGISLLFSAINEEENLLLFRMSGVGVGAAVLILSKLTRGQIGIGDGLILCGTGFALGGTRNLALLFYALVLAAAFSGILLIFRHVGKQYRIPFIPFIFSSYIMILSFY